MLANYTFGDVMWSFLVFFAWVIWFWLLLTVFADLFRRHDISGWGKTGWIILVILIPYFGVFIYLIAEHEGMAKRNIASAQQSQQQFDDYVQRTAGGGGAADEIGKAKSLLDAGTITQAEFDQIKAKALAT